MATTRYIPIAETAGDEKKGEVERSSVDSEEERDLSGAPLETSKGKFILLIIGMCRVHQRPKAYYVFQQSLSRTSYVPNSCQV